MDAIIPIILAGGTGSRLWPLSRESFPKQFLKLSHEDDLTLLQKTYKRIADLENAYHTFIVPGGQAAIALVYLTFCKSGSHALIPYSVYGPNREMADGMLRRLSFTIT